MVPSRLLLAGPGIGPVLSEVFDKQGKTARNQRKGTEKEYPDPEAEVVAGDP